MKQTVKFCKVEQSVTLFPVKLNCLGQEKSLKVFNMSPSSKMEMELKESENNSIHEYAFGILSSDKQGNSTVVGISEKYKRNQRKSESTEEEEDDDRIVTERFQSWSMSAYQSAKRGQKDIVSDDEVDGDTNNNVTSLAASAPDDSFLNDYRLHFQDDHAEYTVVSISMMNSKPSSKPGLPRRWSSSSLFWGKGLPQQQNRSLPVDPDDPGMILREQGSDRWFSSITHIPDRIRQHMADKNRFNVKNVPREKLKQLQCY